MTGFLVSVGSWWLGAFEKFGRGFLFFLEILRGLPALLMRPGLLIKELHSVGVLSLTIIRSGSYGTPICRTRGLGSHR